MEHRSKRQTSAARPVVAALPPAADTAAATPTLLQRDAKRQYFRRMWLGRIFSSVRYLATVRRAMGMPRSLKNLDDLVIAQRRAAVLVLDQVENGLFHAGVAQRFTGRSLIAGGEKVFHLKHALRRGHVFAGHGAANCGLVHPHGIGNFSHRHRLQMRRAMFKEIALPRNDLLRDVRELFAGVDGSSGSGIFRCGFCRGCNL